MEGSGFYIAFNFDNAVVKDKFPSLGEEIPGAIRVLSLIQKKNYLILFTTREGDQLEEAIHFLRRNGIDLYGINDNPGHFIGHDSMKPFYHLLIDSKAIGAPLIQIKKGRGYINWSLIEKYLWEKGVI
jgi:hypothetical protein